MAITNLAIVGGPLKLNKHATERTTKFLRSEALKGVCLNWQNILEFQIIWFGIDWRVVIPWKILFSLPNTRD
jgi:hypothetical protein